MTWFLLIDASKWHQICQTHTQCLYTIHTPAHRYAAALVTDTTKNLVIYMQPHNRHHFHMPHSQLCQCLSCNKTHCSSPGTLFSSFGSQWTLILKDEWVSREYACHSQIFFFLFFFSHRRWTHSCVASLHSWANNSLWDWKQKKTIHRVTEM